MNIFLIGFMGSGKSTFGRKLAKRLGYDFVDTDKRITEQYGMSINEIFERLGEKAFREGETRLLKELALKRNLVVSTGGGLPCHGDNMATINRHGLSVYLKCEPEDLYRRLLTRKEKRPLIRDLSDAELRSYIVKKLAERESFYMQARHVVRGPDVDLEKLLKLLGD